MVPELLFDDFSDMRSIHRPELSVGNFDLNACVCIPDTTRERTDASTLRVHMQPNATSVLYMNSPSSERFTMSFAW